MLTVTDKAVMTLERSLDGQKEEAEDVLRITRSGDQFGIVLSHEEQDDQIIDHDGRIVLVLDPDVSDALDGLTLDTMETPDGIRLTIQEA